MGSLSLVRPDQIEEFSDMGDEEKQEPAHQEESYRRAWEPFNPNEEEQYRGDAVEGQPLGMDAGEGEGDRTLDEEGATGRNLRAPKGPTPKEVEEHSVTHWPFRDWCEHCVRGRAKSMGHRRRK